MCFSAAGTSAVSVSLRDAGKGSVGFKEQIVKEG